MFGALHMGWRHVLFANWPVAPEEVAPHVPDAMTLDTYDDRAWLSVVPFTNVDVRPVWLPPGWGFELPELNLRTYVVCDGVPGVYFFSLDAQGVLGVLGARVLHRLPYYYARIDLTAEDGEVRFQSRRRHPGARPVDFRATYLQSGEELPVEAGSLATFLTERYRYYTEAPTGAVRYAVVEHESWPLYRAEVTIDEHALFRANGFDVPDAEPVYHYSPGVDTKASASRRL